MATDNEIDRTLVLCMEANDAGERIVRVAASDGNLDASFRQRGPTGAVQTDVRKGKKIHILGGAGNTVNGHRGGTDNGETCAGSFERPGHPHEQAQPISRSRHRLGWRVACRRR